MEIAFQLTKSLLGHHHVSYKCPKCGDDLRSPLAEAGKPDTCPNCNARFIVPGADELRRLTEAREAEAIAREQRRQDQLRQQNERAAARAREMEGKATQERERETQEQSRKCSLCGVEVHGDSPVCDACKSVASGGKRPNRSAVIGTLSLSAVVLVSLFFGYPWVRNFGLRKKLDACESSGIIRAKVTYEGLISTDGVVFDVLDGESASARRIDPVHLLLQFAGRLDLYSVERVVLARNGREVVYVSSAELRPLADSYAGGGRVWAFNNLPASVRTMSGDRAYSEWSGGWLGVLKKQTEDVNDFIRDWTGY